MVGSHEDGYAVNKSRVDELNARTTRIRDLNDAFRRGRGSGMMVMTPGIKALGTIALTGVLAAIRTFDAFDPGNDPYAEHDFGSIEAAGQRIFWKIDCYDKQLEYGSPDASDPDQTTRVLTIMLAEEY